MSVLFISDLHLAPERPAVTRAFLSFLSDRAARRVSVYSRRSLRGLDWR